MLLFDYETERVFYQCPLCILWNIFCQAHIDNFLQIVLTPVRIFLEESLSTFYVLVVWRVKPLIGIDAAILPCSFSIITIHTHNGQTPPTSSDQGDMHSGVSFVGSVKTVCDISEVCVEYYNCDFSSQHTYDANRCFFTYLHMDNKYGRKTSIYVNFLYFSYMYSTIQNYFICWIIFPIYLHNLPFL